MKMIVSVEDMVTDLKRFDDESLLNLDGVGLVPRTLLTRIFLVLKETKCRFAGLEGKKNTALFIVWKNAQGRRGHAKVNTVTNQHTRKAPLWRPAEQEGQSL